MKRMFLIAVAIAGLGLLEAACAATGVNGTFVQLNRDTAKMTLADWSADIAQMKTTGIHILIIQWCADDNIAYIKDDTLPQREQYDTVRTILEATKDEKIDVYLGLQADIHFWTRIRATDRVLRDYFLARTADNERIQQVLLKHFADVPHWKGYYIPDEIDDLSWRDPERQLLFNGYVRTLVKQLRKNDRARKINISAFFRSRTAPDVFARNLKRITTGTGLDHVLVQDGIGAGDPPQKYIPIYFRALADSWRREESELWLVVETFERTSSEDKPFAAAPAKPERVRKQLRDGADHFDTIVMFTFPDYVDPDLGAPQRELYQSLKE